VGGGCVAADFEPADFVAPAFVARGFVARGFVAPDFVARAFVAAVFAAAGFVALALDLVAAAPVGRSRPRRAGRVDGRLPRTLGWAFAAFFGFFFADFSAMAPELERNSLRDSRLQWLQSTGRQLR
jgi:hypothetical protein